MWGFRVFGSGKLWMSAQTEAAVALRPRVKALQRFKPAVHSASCDAGCYFLCMYINTYVYIHI